MDNFYVDQYYVMNPETDDLIRGDKLKNGMRVLLESSISRHPIDPKGKYTPEQLVSLDKWNRWCVVSDLRIGSRQTYFIGIYDDGTKFTFGRDLVNGWYVKKDSIPAPIETPEFKYQMELNVFNLVKDRLLKLNTDQYHGNLIDFSEEAKSLTDSLTAIFAKEITAFVNDLKKEMGAEKDRKTPSRYVSYADYREESVGRRSMPRRCYYCTMRRCEEAKQTPALLASEFCPCCIAQHDEIGKRTEETEK